MSERVRIVSFCGGTDNKYVGLTGEVVEVFFRRQRPLTGDETYRLMMMVKLDNDPAPHLQALTGGLPVLPEEVEVLAAN